LTSCNKPLVWWGHWYPEGHNNCRYEALLPRLTSVHAIYQRRGQARWRQAIRGRLDNWLFSRFLYPGIVRRLASRYPALFCTDIRYIPYFHGPIIVDDDDPVFTPERIALLNRPNVLAVVTTTEQLREQFLSLGLAKPCHVIPSGVHLSLRNDGRKKELEKKLEKQESDIVVGFSVPYLYTDEDLKAGSPEAALRSIGFLSSVMEKVWEQAPLIKLWLMGVPSRTVQAYARKHPQVRLLGYVTHTEVLNYFANFDIAVYPRLVDLSGRHSIKLVEFMAAGVPIVSTSVTEAFHVRASQSGIIATDRESFVQAILELAAHRDLRQAYSEKGKLYAESYSWENLARQYESQVLRHHLTQIHSRESQ